MSEVLDKVCADCGYHQAHMNSCERCGSKRVITVAVAKRIAGENYMDCFDPNAMTFPVLTLRDGRLWINVEHMSNVLRESGRVKKEDALEAADCLDELLRQHKAMFQQLISVRTTLELVGEVQEVAEITKMFADMRLQSADIKKLLTDLNLWPVEKSNES